MMEGHPQRKDLRSVNGVRRENYLYTSLIITSHMKYMVVHLGLNRSPTSTTTVPRGCNEGKGGKKEWRDIRPNNVMQIPL